MAVSDSHPEVALAAPLPVMPPVPIGKPPPMRKQAGASKSAANGSGEVASNAAALWDSSATPFEFDDPLHEVPIRSSPPPLDSEARFVKPLSRAAMSQAAEPDAPPVALSPPGLSAVSEVPAHAKDESDIPEPAKFEEDESAPILMPRRGLPGLRRAAAFLTSTVVHMAGLIAAALVVVSLPEESKPAVLVVNILPEPEEQVDTLELDSRVTAAASFTAAGSLSSANEPRSDSAIGGPGSKLAIVGEPALDKAVVALAAAENEVIFAPALAFAPTKERLVAATPDGALGDPRAVVDNYDEAFDRLTQEILWMLAQRDVLVTWCFDQSESMKDDQALIRDRVDRVYAELGLTSQVKGEHLLSAVTSFGKGFLIHTPRPTSNTQELRAAIEALPIDPSGKEMMCQAVGASIGAFHEQARRQNRQMALILVTDESGDPQSNVQFLETALAAAKTADCRVYVLGREAVFGYPYAHMRWVHPQTNHEHWLQIDRGPETAFVEQLQTEGFRRRYDSFNSGFGPYEQTRLARETGGIFFMLPSTETKLVRDSEKRRYQLDAMRAYRPDLRARAELFVERERSPIRAMLSQIVFDLDPNRPEVAKIMEVGLNFPPHAPEFVPAAAKEQMKAKNYLVYLDRAAKSLESIRRYRDQELSPRWQANYDLIYAQLLAYTARTYEYGVMFDKFIAKPKIVPLLKPGQMALAGWSVSHSRQTVGGELSKAYIDRSAGMFHKLIEDHPGTPWAARAKWELDRGFGFELHEHYHYVGPRPPKPNTPSRPTVPLAPIPNL